MMGPLEKNMFPKINMFFEKGPFQNHFFSFSKHQFLGKNARGVFKFSGSKAVDQLLENDRCVRGRGYITTWNLKRPLCLALTPPKQGLCQSKQGAPFGVF